jgi:hypothetical protein
VEEVESAAVAVPDVKFSQDVHLLTPGFRSWWARDHAEQGG